MLRLDVPMGTDPIAGAVAMRPQMYAGMDALAAAAYTKTQLPIRILEGARMRIAQLNGCQICQGADRYVADHRSLDTDEALWAQLHEAFTDDELVDLGLFVGASMVGGRFLHVFGLDSACVATIA